MKGLYIHPDRVRLMNEAEYKSGPVVYWMGRDQRCEDNWALIYSQKIALEKKAPLAVVFCLAPAFLDAALRQYDFMLAGLKELGANLGDKKIPFKILFGDPVRELTRFLADIKAGFLVCDFEPLNIKRRWKEAVLEKIKIPFHEVDARNIVPCHVASDKQEYSAFTFRKKATRLFGRFMDDYPSIVRHPHALDLGKTGNVDDLIRKLKVDRSVEPVDWIRPGEDAAREELKIFIKNKLARYDVDRNDPTIDGQSGLSPYLHFGQISSLRVVREVLKSDAPKNSKQAFIEELFVRRELSDNYCFHNSNYGELKGLPAWCQRTLKKHGRDKREYVYSVEKLESAKTHDDAWNAAQMEMVKKGKMHGYMRMYWAKKILEWSATPEDALQNAIYLNDKYELDGRDTNGYAGIMWSIGGLHDRPWGERKIFGLIRYMSFGGLKTKFDISKYISKNV